MSQGVRFRSLFVPLSTGVPAALYEPVEGEDCSTVAFMFMHPDANFISHAGCAQLAQRGHRVLGVNSRFANLPGPTGGPYVYHEVIPDAAAGVAHLRSLPGVETVVLVGHSGGGPLFSAYQNLAENGAAAFQGSEKLTQGPDSLDGLPPADALVLLDSHVGYGAHGLFSLDPAVVDESRPTTRDPALDMFEPANGYDPGGTSYSKAFVERYLQAQAERMLRLARHAQDRIARIDTGRGDYPDDEPMVVPGLGSRLWLPDTGLLSRTRGEWPLLRADGSVQVQVVPSLRPRSGRPSDQRGYPGVLVTSVRRFLATHAIRTLPEYGVTGDGLTGVDWHSSYTSAPANLEGVTVPLLSLVMTAHWFPVPNETNFQHAGSQDKEMAMVEGATHWMTPCLAVEQTSGQFGDTLKTTFDHVDRWTRVRFEP